MLNNVDRPQAVVSEASPLPSQDGDGQYQEPAFCAILVVAECPKHPA